ncbi:MAG: translation elongation factor Ts [Burkholderiales bacterium]|nr:translation elongation factor Ts [Burkholderiales bacterium]
MAEISASVVMELRQRTGLGMMECKKALLETEGDLEKAEDLLRIKSGAKANKAAGRIAAEGTVGGFVATDGKTAALVEVNCETDFVARNEDFLKLAKDLAELVATKNPADVEALSALPLKSGEYEGTVETVRQALVQKIGENLSVRRFARRTTAARLVQYLHGGGRIGVTIEIDGDEVAGKDIALHVAASVAGTRPLCIAKEEVPAELVNKEREIFTAQAAESGKPAEIVAKMVEGRVAKYLAEVALLGQPFVKNPDETVEQYLKGKKASVKAFDLFVVGEGIEKKKDDFAAEVAAMTKG